MASLNDWAAELKDILPWVTDIRRTLHRHPELSGMEAETCARIEREVPQDAEIFRFEGCHGLMVTLRNGAGPCAAVRADMDALPIREETGLPFASENPGVMHACGHDVHMALALGSLRWFHRNRDRWHGTVRWLFEPQEETTGGGALMVAQGCMKNPDVSCIIGQHVTPLYPAGTFYCKTGYVSGSSTDVRLTVRGKACHGAYPERGTDAIVIAAQVISALQSWSSRNRSPFEPAVFTLGTIEGGTANNIVCGEVRMAGTLRTLSNEIRKEAKERLAAIAEGVAAGMGGEAEMRFIPSYGPVYNNDRYYALVEQRALGLLGPERMVRRAAPSLGVESFCFFVQETPGVYYDIGSGVSTGLHTSTFLVDEAMLLPALALQCEAVLAVLEAD